MIEYDQCLTSETLGHSDQYFIDFFFHTLRNAWAGDICAQLALAVVFGREIPTHITE